jgi:putative DNA primase/helicase
MARCPAQADHNPSLSIQSGDDGKILVRCFAGCEQHRVIAILKARGLWSESGRGNVKGISRFFMAANRIRARDAEMRQLAACILERTIAVGGTIVETYLGSRHIVIPVPPAIRFHAALKHPSGGRWLAMIAPVTRGVDGLLLGIHRTFLARDGSGKAPVDLQKMMLGSCGGGAVRLAPLGSVLMVGEGIETCIAAMQATGHPAWAALSTSGLRTLDLSKDIRDVIVLADGDDAGEAAARDCAWRWKQRVAACASRVHREEWISTTCWWNANPVLMRARNESRRYQQTRGVRCRCH